MITLKSDTAHSLPTYGSERANEARSGVPFSVGDHLAPPPGSKVVLSAKRTSSQLLEWINTGRQPKNLAVATAAGPALGMVNLHKQTPAVI